MIVAFAKYRGEKLIVLHSHDAKAIVREINSVLPQKINLMDTQGTIIASTDPLRIGTYHEGAAKILREGLNELRISVTDTYAGTRPGTNFLLCARGKAIGVLGITGNYHEILPIANVIRKMVEILVKAQEWQRVQTQVELRRERFLQALLTQGEYFISKETIDRGASLGIHLSTPRRVLALNFISQESSSTVFDDFEAIIQIIKNLDASLLFCRMPSLLYLLTEHQDTSSLRVFAQKLKRIIERQLPLQVYIGIDSPARDFIHLREASQQAHKALLSCRRAGEAPIKFYDDMNMEIFTDAIPHALKLAYVHKIFKDYTPAEMSETMHTLEALFHADGSITHAAETLFIHKNTLQQHLRKIAQRTGYDPRTLRGAAVLYLTLYFYREFTGDFAI